MYWFDTSSYSWFFQIFQNFNPYIFFTTDQRPERPETRDHRPETTDQRPQTTAGLRGRHAEGGGRGNHAATVGRYERQRPSRRWRAASSRAELSRRR